MALSRHPRPVYALLGIAGYQYDATEHKDRTMPDEITKLAAFLGITELQAYYHVRARRDLARRQPARATNFLK